MRKIIHIDEDKCNGCGLCIPNCAEGAMKVIDGKAKLISDNLCDGLGECLGHCPQDAISLIEREADAFDEKAVENHLKQEQIKTSKQRCPGSKVMAIEEGQTEQSNVKINSQLRQWPVQLHLVPPDAPYLQNSDLLITADCVPLAYGNYHQDLLKGKTVVMGCSKLDDIQAYTQKLTEMIQYNDFKSITVAFMEVPCCRGMVRAVETAMENSGKQIPLYKIKISIDGQRENI